MSPRRDPSKVVVCQCLRVTEAEILEAIGKGRARNLRDLARLTLAGDACTACHPLLREYLERYAALTSLRRPLPPPAARTGSSPTPLSR